MVQETMWVGGEASHGLSGEGQSGGGAGHSRAGSHEKGIDWLAATMATRCWVDLA